MNTIFNEIKSIMLAKGYSIEEIIIILQSKSYIFHGQTTWEQIAYKKYMNFEYGSPSCDNVIDFSKIVNDLKQNKKYIEFKGNILEIIEME